MTKTELDAAIYQKYIAPTERPPQRVLGPEFEFPILNLRRAAVDFDALQPIVRAFAAQFGFSAQQHDADGRLYSLTCPETGDNLSFDCSYNTLELSFGKECDIHILDGRFREYYAYLQAQLLAVSHTLTGMGVNPYYRYNTCAPIANGRYRMLWHYLHSYPQYDGPQYHDVPQFSMLAAASQVQLDVGKAQIIQTINTYNKLEPLKALLFANSWYDRKPELLISRDRFWAQSTQGYNPHNVDMYDTELHDLDELIAYIETESMYCTERDGRYYHFRPMRLPEYFAADAVTGEYFDETDGAWHTDCFAPQPEDLAYLRSFKFADLTYRGTVEFRSACEQPVREIFAHTAFHAGLAEQTGALAELLAADHVIYRHGYSPRELRALFSRRTLPSFADRAALSWLLRQVLALAEDGLRQRGLHEECYLAPLFDRAERLASPALDMVRGLERGDSVEQWVTAYAALG